MLQTANRDEVTFLCLKNARHQENHEKLERRCLTRRIIPVETPANALVVQDGIDAVVTKSGQVPVNAAKQSSPRAAASISTARPVNTAAPKSKMLLWEMGENVVRLSMLDLETTGNVIDHTSKIEDHYMFKRLDYVDLTRQTQAVKAWVPKRTNSLILMCRDETSRILKTFITGIENQITHKVKIIRCGNGTEFKNNDMNQFCGMKGIKKEFSVARTLQQNRVAERKNKILIEAAKTMLTNSLLPTTFWAETVNTACYVQNRVLVIKPHNKTPYELLHVRPPSISFMRPFGCPMTILNTLDPLGKFDKNVMRGLGFDNADDQERIDSNTQDVNTAGPSINTASENINTGSSNINTASHIPNDPSMQSLEATGIFDDAYDDREEVEPKKVIQALTDPSWIEAMQEELLQFKLQKVWTLVDLPKGKRAIGTKWVYRNKKDERGIVVRNKARLVAQGYTQEEGIDYDEVFAPVARIEAIRLFLAYASFMGLIVYQMDVKSAFLYGTIEEEVYVCQPPGFEDPQFPDKVYKVEKALYGLHQAPRAWYETLSTYLLENRYRRGTIDKTLFIKKDRDDAQDIPDKFYGRAHFFLRVEASTPIETNKALNKDEEDEDVDVYLHRSMIGSLMYLIASRPDIMFVVCACARDSLFDLEAFSNSDYARASLDRKSTIGGCQFLSKRLISWQCKKQTIVANSNTKAEYVAATNCYRQTQKPRKAKRTTEISQSSGPIHLVADETVYKEWEDRMERAATTASSLEAEQDSGNINRTQSIATLNESFPQGTDSGSGLRIGVDTARHKLNTASIKLVLPGIF
ncbi:retrovirus-related pol polyprotein from transposon TNT 1-94 [Tanacetum coccineum]